MLTICLVIILVGAVVAGLFPTDQSWQTLPRLLLGTLAVLVIPGYAGMRVFGFFPTIDSLVERCVLAVGVSYVMIMTLSVVVTLGEVSLMLAASAFLLAVLALILFLPRRVVGGEEGRMRSGAEPNAAPPRGPFRSLIRVARPSETDYESLVAYGAVALLLIFIIAFTLTVEPKVMGEEVAELITIRKIIENPAITLTNLLHRPDAIPTYIFTPYYFMVALITKFSGLSMFVVYVKLRAVYVVIALGVFWSLTWRITGSRSLATFALFSFMGLAVLDPDPWSWPASLLPLNRRGAFATGILLPLLLLTTWYVGACRTLMRLREVAFPALLLLATLMTHAMDVLYFFFFYTGILLTSFVAPIPTLSRRRLIHVLGIIALVGVGYLLVQRELVAHVAAYEAPRKAADAAAVVALLNQPMSAFLGGIPEGARYLIATSGAVTVYSMFPVLLLPMLVLGTRSIGLTLWSALVPWLVLFAIPIGLPLLMLITTDEVIFAAGYFSLLGFIAFVTAIVALAGTIDRFARRWRSSTRSRRISYRSMVVLLAAALSQYLLLPVSWWLMQLVVTAPSLFVVLALVGGPVALAVRQIRKSNVDIGPFTRPRLSFCMLALSLALPILVGMKAFPGQISGSDRASMGEQFLRHQSIPSVVDWEEYYPYLQRSTNPTIDLPWQVVEDLRRLVPRGEVMVYDPAHSYTIPLLLNDYVVNPGHVLSTDLAYFDKYVKKGADGADVHPIFNSNSALTDDDIEFLRSYEVDYVLANPKYRDIVQRKLAVLSERTSLVYDRGGFLLYRLSHAEGIRS